MADGGFNGFARRRWRMRVTALGAKTREERILLQ